jgi:four helix bundle protein
MDTSNIERVKRPVSDLKERSRQFALRIIKLVESLPQTRTANVLSNQLLRSGTSVAANYRAACRARSNAYFIAKMGIVEEETDESVF